MRLERLLMASGFHMTVQLRRLLKQHVNGRNRLYRWVLVGPSMFMRWSLDLIEPAFVLSVEPDAESFDGLDVFLSVRDPRTFQEINLTGYNRSGDRF